jgi:tetratricopeptide (TPR) repeat protein
LGFYRSCGCFLHHSAHIDSSEELAHRPRSGAFMKLLISFLFCLLFALNAVDAASPVLSPELEAHRAKGYDALMNMNYEEAREQFQQMIETDPKHPAGYIYLSHAVWQNHLATLRRLQTRMYNKTDAFFRETKEEVDSRVDKEFQKWVGKGVALAEERLKKNENDITGLYYLGIAKNTMAGYDATVKRSFFSALRSGSKGTGLHRKLIKIDPSFVDAKMSIGLYNYVIGSLPVMVKILVFFGGVHGSKKEGLKLLQEVAQKGNYSRDEAAILLVMLYSREKRKEDSLKIVDRLAETYPGNSLFRLEKANLLDELKKYDKSFDVYEGLLADPSAYEYMPDLIHYQYAEALFDAKHWEKATVHYLDCSQNGKAPDGLVTMALLGAGQSLDAQGKRSEAISRYKKVLKRREALDSHDLASKYLKKPYQPD